MSSSEVDALILKTDVSDKSERQVAEDDNLALRTGRSQCFTAELGNDYGNLDSL